MFIDACGTDHEHKVRADLKALVPAKTAKARDTPSPDGLLVVYVTPERIAKSKLFMSVLEQIYGAGRLGLLAIDEAHCISQWGHDFRPDYEKLAALRVQFPKTPILALTATANSTVAGDVQKSLGIRGLEFRSPTNRSNLFYMVRHRPKAPGEAMHIHWKGSPSLPGDRHFQLMILPRRLGAPCTQTRGCDTRSTTDECVVTLKSMYTPHKQARARQR